MWLRNYDILKLSGSLPAYKLNGSGPNQSQKLWVTQTDGSKAWLDNATNGTTNGFAAVLNRTWTTDYHTNLRDYQITVDIGTGTSSPKYTDYELAAPLNTSKITKTIVTAGNPILNLDTHKWTVQVSIDFKNISGSEIVVSEWGIFTRGYASAIPPACIYRDVLSPEKRITVAANAYCRMDFEYEVELPPALQGWGDTITDTWEQIVANADAGTVSAYNVGDTKTLQFTYNDTIYYVQAILLGKEHDTISGTEKKAALSWQFNNIAMSHSMNSSNTSIGGWMGETGDLYATSLDETDGVLTHGCGMRKFVAGLLNCFPTIIKDNIKVVDKLYDDNSVIQKCKDKLWLLSGTELNYTVGWVRGGQGDPYKLFTDGATTRRDSGSSYSEYWTRSCATGYSGVGFCFTSAVSTPSADYASKSYGVALGFCL